MLIGHIIIKKLWNCIDIWSDSIIMAPTKEFCMKFWKKNKKQKTKSIIDDSKIICNYFKGLFVVLILILRINLNWNLIYPLNMMVIKQKTYCLILFNNKYSFFFIWPFYFFVFFNYWKSLKNIKNFLNGGSGKI